MSSRVMAPHVQRPAPPKTYNMQGQPENQSQQNEVSEQGCIHWLTRSLRAPGGPCTKSMEVSESRMERVNDKL